MSMAEQEAEGMLQITQQPQGDTVMHVWTIAPLAMLLQITPTWVISNNQLFITSHPAIARSAVQHYTDVKRQSKLIRSQAGFQQVATQLPANLLGFGYVDSKVQIKQLKGLADRFWPMLAAMVAQQAEIKLPIVLPDITAAADRMGPGCDMLWTESDGFYFRSQGPIPTGGMVLVGGAAMAVSVLMPALGQARFMAKSVKCASQLRGLGIAIAMYQNDFSEKNPANLEELIEKEDVSPKALVCPSSSDSVGQCSYVYRGADLNAMSDGGLILIYDKYENHKGEFRNVLFAAGHVEKLTEEQFQQAIVRDNELRRKKGLSEKPVEQ